MAKQVLCQRNNRGAIGDRRHEWITDNRRMTQVFHLRRRLTDAEIEFMNIPDGGPTLRDVRGTSEEIRRLRLLRQDLPNHHPMARLLDAKGLFQLVRSNHRESTKIVLR